MTEPWAAVGTAAWLGILTSISPCPLASNVAAVSFVGRSVGSPRRALVAGLAYSLGRALTYVLVGGLVVTGLLSVPGLSQFLQERVNQILGPFLILAGLVMAGWVRIPLPAWGSMPSSAARLGSGGVGGAGALGMLFALSFCPVSAGIFFGALIPLAAGAGSRLVLPAVYGLGTGLPVVLFALLLVFGARGVGRAFHVLTAIERGARPVTGVVFLLAGVYLVARYLFRLDLG